MSESDLPGIPAGQTAEPQGVSRWLVEALHDETIAAFGGRDGLRDEHLLESALARPRQVWHYRRETSLVDLAAALAFELVRNHPFVDGNKRVGLLAIRAFFHLNGLAFVPDEEATVLAIEALASGDLNEAALASWISSHVRER